MDLAIWISLPREIYLVRSFCFSGLSFSFYLSWLRCLFLFFLHSTALGSGFWIQYTGGDRTAFGSRAVNVSCICVCGRSFLALALPSVAALIPSSSYFSHQLLPRILSRLPVEPTVGSSSLLPSLFLVSTLFPALTSILENPSTPASYQLTFVSPYCCPAQPQPVSVNATCRVCEYAVSAVRLELAYHPTSSQVNSSSCCFLCLCFYLVVINFPSFSLLLLHPFP